MIAGKFRDGHPWATLSLPGANGALEVEFIVDTGFDGDLALPVDLARQLGGSPVGFRKRALAGGALLSCPFYEIPLEWGEDMRRTEVLALEGNPLLGTAILQDYLLQIEITDGGEVIAEPL